MLRTDLNNSQFFPGPLPHRQTELSIRPSYSDILQKVPPFLTISPDFSTMVDANAINKSGFPLAFLKAVAEISYLLGVAIGVKDGPDMPQKYSQYFNTISHPKPIDFSQKSSRHLPLRGFLPTNPVLGRLDEHGIPKPSQQFDKKHVLFSSTSFKLTKNDFCYGLLEKKEYEIKDLTSAEDGKTLKITFINHQQQMPQGIDKIQYSISLPLKPDQTLSSDDLNLTDDKYPWLKKLLDNTPVELHYELIENAKENTNEGKQDPDSLPTVEIWGYDDGQQVLPICSDADVFLVSVPHDLIRAIGSEISEVHDTAKIIERIKMIRGIEKILEYLHGQASTPSHPASIDDIEATLHTIKERLSPRTQLPIEKKTQQKFAARLLEDISKSKKNPGCGTALEIIVYHLIMEKYVRYLQENNPTVKVHPRASEVIQHCSESGLHKKVADKVSDIPCDPVTFFFPRSPADQIMQDEEHTETLKFAECRRTESQDDLLTLFLTAEGFEGQFITISRRWYEPPEPSQKRLEAKENDDEENKVGPISGSDSALPASSEQKPTATNNFCARFFSRVKPLQENIEGSKIRLWKLIADTESNSVPKSLGNDAPSAIYDRMKQKEFTKK
jgi:hypothetical protein